MDTAYVIGNGESRNIFPIKDLLFVNIVKVFDSNLNQIIVGTDTGLLHIIQLP